MADLFHAIRSQSNNTLPPLFYALRQWAKNKTFAQKTVRSHGDYVSNYMLLNLCVFYLQAKTDRVLQPVRLATPIGEAFKVGYFKKL